MTKARRTMLGALALVLGAAATMAAQTVPAGARGCSMTHQGSDTIRLDSNTVVSLDAVSVAMHGGSTMITGNLVRSWRPGAASQDGAAATDALIGVLRTSDGRFVGVPNPLPGRDVLSPRAIAASDGSWDFVWTTGFGGGAFQNFYHDSVALWTGQFDGRHWTGVQNLAQLGRLRVAANLSAELVRSGQLVATAMGYQEQEVMGQSTRRGVLIARRDSIGWHFDSLETFRAPEYLQLAAGVAPGTLVLLSVNDTRFEGRYRQLALMTSKFSSQWSALRPAIPFDEIKPAHQLVTPFARIHSSRELLSWRYDSLDMRLKEGPLAMRVSTASGSVTTRVFGVNQPMDDFGFASVGPGRELWLTRDGTSRSSMHAYMSLGSEVLDLGTFAMPLATFRIVVAANDDGEVHLSSIRLAGLGAGQWAESVFHRYRVRCSPH